MQIDNGQKDSYFRANRKSFDAAIRLAVAAALSNQKRLGIPAATWKDGHVVMIPPEQIASSSEPS
jgi:hypothetical protein